MSSFDRFFLGLVGGWLLGSYWARQRQAERDSKSIRFDIEDVEDVGPAGHPPGTFHPLPNPKTDGWPPTHWTDDNPDSEPHDHFTDDSSNNG